MTDTRNFLNQMVSATQAFVLAYEQMQLIADRIAADSFLAQNVINGAGSSRPDLAVADINNLNSAVQFLETKLNGSDPSVNTGGSVKLAFYKII